MTMDLSCFNRVYKTNMTDLLDLPILLKKNATAKYFRELFERARKKGIYRKRAQEIDADNGVFFETEVNGKVYRYTFCYAFSSHSLDGLVVES